MHFRVVPPLSKGGAVASPSKPGGPGLKVTCSGDEKKKRLCFLKHHSLVFLSHAAHDTNDFVGVGLLFLFEPSQSAVGLVFCLLPNAAGVEQDGVGLARGVGQFVTALTQAGDNHFTVQHVHLAADGFDVQTVGCFHGIFENGLSAPTAGEPNGMSSNGYLYFRKGISPEPGKRVIKGPSLTRSN